ncbi:MAG: penicillin-binding protein activator [archaeon]
MKKNTIYFFIISIVIILIITTFIIEKNKASNEIKIGIIYPLSGNLADAGNTLLKITNYAVENEKLLENKKIKLFIEDGGCDSKLAATSARKLIDVDNVKIIIGGLCSSEALAIAPIAEENKVVLITPTAASPDITYSGDYIFRIAPADDTAGIAIANYALSKNLKKAALLVEQTDYSQSISKVFKKKFLENNGEIITEQYFSSDSRDIKSIITNIKNSNSNFLYIIPQDTKTLDIIIKQLQELNYSKQIFTNDFIGSNDLLDKFGTLLDGIIYTEPDFNEVVKNTKEFLDKLEENLGKLSFPLSKIYFTTTYDTTSLIIEGINYCKDDNSECIKNYLYTIKDRNLKSGKLTIDNYGDVKFQYAIKEIKDGKPKVIEKVKVN